MSIPERSAGRKLEDILLKRISCEGSLSFSEFMREALYHPRYGFYAAPDRVGRKGDFFTSVSVGSLFGELLAEWVIEQSRYFGRPDSFTIIEQGADAGNLCADILASIRDKDADFYACLTYQIIEPLDSLVEIQRTTLEASRVVDKVHWADSPHCVRHPAGVFLSNELVDSFPVQLVCFKDGRWMERRVGVSGMGSLEFDDSHRAPEPSLREIRRWKIPEIEGYCAEIHLEATSWMRAVAATLERGVFLTVDYGYPAEVLYAPGRTAGTLQAYRNHRRSNDVLDVPGEQDLTAHVHFDLLVEEGRRVGLEPVSFQDQHHFLVEIARQGWLQGIEKAIQLNPSDPLAAKKIRGFQSLMHPEMMGTTFRCLVQHKK
jgi:SAM-dependent MidA family methyltransferase